MTEPTDTNRKTPSPAAEGHAAQDVRQGEIILNSRWRVIVFMAGLVGLVIIGIIAALLRF